jgi:hypothetical protein
MGEDDKKPIPREEPTETQQVLSVLATLGQQMTKFGEQMTDVQTSMVDVVARVSRLEAHAPGSNPPPRTESGFLAAVDARAKAISTTTESEADRATKQQVEVLTERIEDALTAVARVESKTDAQTVILKRIADAGESLIRNPTVRRVAYAVGTLVAMYVTHYTATHH